MDGEPVAAPTGAHQCLDDDDLRLLALLAEGLPTLAVARALNTSPRTLQRRTREVCDRIGVRSTVEAVAWAARRQLI
ncbi:MAG TPA: LuxR C-terminal-related transcriptional regulator [Jatrophihabitans sp.]|nr:LuxR C-terminal-related transcriptional regulator [Jatrophihabitans sp.]